MCWFDRRVSGIFLHFRTQQTRVGNALSNKTNLTSGVIQGSVLFVIFINDIAQLFPDNTCTCKLYADDLKLYTALEANTDCCILQSKLIEVCKWSKKWQLSISYTKCSVIYVGNTNCNVNMTLNDNILLVVDEVKDLGFIIDSHLSFDSHISKTVARAFTRANLIHKCFTTWDCLLYTSPSPRDS